MMCKPHDGDVQTHHNNKHSTIIITRENGQIRSNSIGDLVNRGGGR